MRAPRGLSVAEAEVWSRVAATVKPLEPRRVGAVLTASIPAAVPVPEKRPTPDLPPQRAPVAPPPPTRPLDSHGLDGSWERKLAKAAIAPEFTLDLHGHTLAQAHQRLDLGLAQAAAQGARLVLVITGRPRPADDEAHRGERRGAIRAKLLDWLAAGSHAGRIAAVRPAHPRHGGAGAVYVVLRRGR